MKSAGSTLQCNPGSSRCSALGASAKVRAHSMMMSSIINSCKFAFELSLKLLSYLWLGNLPTSLWHGCIGVAEPHASAHKAACMQHWCMLQRAQQQHWCMQRATTQPSLLL